MPPAIRRWFSLTRIASSRPKRWLRPPPQRTAYFSSARRPGVVLRVSRIVDAGAGDLVDVAAGQRRDPGQPADEVERGSLAGEDRARWSRDLGEHRRRASIRVPSARERATETALSSAAKTAAATATPQETPGSSSSSSARHRLSRGTSSSVVRSPPPTSSRSAVATTSAIACSLSSTFEPRLAALLEGDVAAGEAVVFAREVAAEVHAAALGHAAARSWRRAGGAGSPNGAAFAARRRCGSGPPHARAPACARRRVRFPGGGSGGGGVCAGAGSVERGERGAAAEDEAFEQRVGGEAVRAVDAGAGALAGGVQAGQRRSGRRGR